MTKGNKWGKCHDDNETEIKFLNLLETQTHCKHSAQLLYKYKSIFSKWTWCLCDRASFNYNDVNNQQDATTFSFINLFNSALHISGDKFTHPQELFLTVYTAFGT